MVSPLDALAVRVAGITAAVARGARRAAAAAAIAALVASGVLLMPSPVGFERQGVAWWLLGLILLLPAGVVYGYSRSVDRLGEMIGGWRGYLTAAADETVAALADLAATVQAALRERRGFGRLAIGAWGLRRLVERFRDLSGAAVPVVAAVSPTRLRLTALAVAVGVGIAAVCALLVLIRVAV